MTNLSIGLVTTAGREQIAEATLHSLGHSDITVYRDLEPGLTRNHLAAWRTLFADPTVTHALLLQDDIIAPHNWRAAVDVFLDRFPDEYAISLYSARAAAASERARKWGHTYIPAVDWLNEQALLLHRDTWTGYSKWIAAGEFADILTPAQCRHHDVMLATFLATRGVSVMLSAPSLFQHVGRESTVGNPWLVFGKPRQAPEWPGVEWDAHVHFDTHLERRPGVALGARQQPRGPR